MKNYLLLVLAMTIINLQAAVTDINPNEQLAQGLMEMSIAEASLNDQLWHELNQGALVNINRVKELIGLGADVNAYTFNEYAQMNITPLIAAIKADNVSLAELLLSNHANPSLAEVISKVDPCLPKAFHMTPLHVATIGGNPRLITLLLEYGANVNSRDYLDRSPLNYALHQMNETGGYTNKKVSLETRFNIYRMLAQASKQQQEK